MLDINTLRRNLDEVVTALAKRGVVFDAERFNQLESQRKEVQVQTEALQARRNTVSKLIGQLKSKGEDASAEMAESKHIPQQLHELEKQLAAIQEEMHEWLSGLPNTPHESVPVGADEEQNVEVRRWVPGNTAADAIPAPFEFETTATAPTSHLTTGC